VKFALQITVSSPDPTPEWEYEKDVRIADALYDVAMEIGSSLYPSKVGDGKRIRDRRGNLIGEWKVVE
jgi:hypothetical protein